MKNLLLFVSAIILNTIILTAQSDIYDVIPDVSTCTSGTLKDSEKMLILAKVNSIRALHGLKPVSYNYSKDINVQRSALITAANENLSHTPPTSWKCYTPEGAIGSEKSNLFVKWYFGSAQPKSEESILGWMIDMNVDVCGHRRWIIDPFLKFIAFGRLEGKSTSNPQFNVHGASIYVIDNDKQNLSDWNDDFVAYPFHNYPTELVFDSKNNYWLFSFTAIFDKTDWWSNRNVSYASATLEIKDANNNVISFSDFSPNNEGYGVPNALKWRMSSLQKDMTYNVSVKNVSFNSNKKDYNYWFKVTDQAGTPPAAPSLVLPSDGATNQNTDLLLTWNLVTDASSYNIQVARDISFSQIAVDQTNISGQNYIANGLTANTKYYWRVSGSNIAGDGPWSVVWSFTTKANAGNGPNLLEPADEANSISTTPVLKWSAINGASSYEVIMSENSTFPQAAITMNQSNIPTTQYTVPKQVLVENTKYYWKVRSNGINGPGSWSSVSSFRTWISSSADDEQSVAAISIMPNPAQDKISISTKLNVMNVNMYSSDGSLITVLNLNEGFVTKDISSYASGVYYLVFVSADRIYSRSFNILR